MRLRPRVPLHVYTAPYNRRSFVRIGFRARARNNERVQNAGKAYARCNNDRTLLTLFCLLFFFFFFCLSKRRCCIWHLIFTRFSPNVLFFVSGNYHEQIRPFALHVNWKSKTYTRKSVMYFFNVRTGYRRDRRPAGQVTRAVVRNVKMFCS
jgi:hypothetical protein